MAASIPDIEVETSGDSTGRRPRGGGATRATPRYLPLFWRVLVTNTVVVGVACAVTVAVLSPERFSSVAAEEALVLAGAVGAIYAANLFLLRRAFAPLEQLTRVAREIDPMSPGQRVPVDDQHSEAGELAAAVNDMLTRLEEERRESARRALAAQEAERLRVARELHDEIGQSLTALLLQLDRAAKHAGAPVRDEVVEAQEAARSTLEDVRRIALELRPEALDDLGLISALEALCDRLAERTGLRVARRLERDFPALGEEAELVIYRVAQEALTNVVRHSGAATAQLRLAHAADRVALSVLDDGRGLDPDADRHGGGLRGMRERAMLIGADLTVETRPAGGVAVRLDVPPREEGPWSR